MLNVRNCLESMETDLLEEFLQFASLVGRMMLYFVFLLYLWNLWYLFIWLCK